MVIKYSFADTGMKSSQLTVILIKNSLRFSFADFSPRPKASLQQNCLKNISNLKNNSKRTLSITYKNKF